MEESKYKSSYDIINHSDFKSANRRKFSTNSVESFEFLDNKANEVTSDKIVHKNASLVSCKTPEFNEICIISNHFRRNSIVESKRILFSKEEFEYLILSNSDVFSLINNDVLYGELNLTNYKLNVSFPNVNFNYVHSIICEYKIYENDSDKKIILETIYDQYKKVDINDCNHTYLRNKLLSLYNKFYYDKYFRVEIKTKTFCKFSFYVNSSILQNFIDEYNTELNNSKIYEYVIDLNRKSFTYDSLSAENNFYYKYNFQKEFTRQQVFSIKDLFVVNTSFYSMIEDYPENIIIPAIVSKDLDLLVKYRSNGRIPALTYYHKNSGGSIWRSAQPITSQKKDYYQADKYFLKTISKLNNKKLVVFELRTYKDAEVSKYFNGGVESIDNIIFCGIPNDNQVEISLLELNKLYLSENYKTNKYFSSLEQTSWFLYISHIIKYCNKALDLMLNSNQTILLHCGDGKNRTNLISSLIQILLDPYYRTIEGFIVLFEKEWLSFSNNFQIYKQKEQSKQNNSSEEQEEKNCLSGNGLFIIYIHCIAQIIIQHKDKFQYNILFLLKITELFYNNRFSSFLATNEKEAKELFKDTNQIWSSLLNKQNYILFENEFCNNNNKEIKNIFFNIKFLSKTDFFFINTPNTSSFTQILDDNIDILTKSIKIKESLLCKNDFFYYNFDKKINLIREEQKEREISQLRNVLLDVEALVSSKKIKKEDLDINNNTCLLIEEANNYNSEGKGHLSYQKSFIVKDEYVKL